MDEIGSSDTIGHPNISSDLHIFILVPSIIPFHEIIPYLMLLIACCSCNSNQTNSIPADSTTASKTVADTGHYDRLTNLNLNLTDTIKRSVGMAFSDTSFKDQFVLTIPPGKVKETRSRLQIISPDGKYYIRSNLKLYFL